MEQTSRILQGGILQAYYDYWSLTHSKDKHLEWKTEGVECEEKKDVSGIKMEKAKFLRNWMCAYFLLVVF